MSVEKSADYFSLDDKGVVLRLRVQPNSKRTGPLGTVGEETRELRWGVKSPAKEGKANAEVVKSVAEFFNLPKSRVTILRGDSSRLKAVLLSGLGAEEWERRKIGLEISGK